MNRVAKLCTWGLPAAALLLAAMSGGALAENPNNEAKKAAAAAKKAEADARKWAKKDISLSRTGGFIIGGNVPFHQSAVPKTRKLGMRAFPSRSLEGSESVSLATPS